MKEWNEMREKMEQNTHSVFVSPAHNGAMVMLPHAMLQEAGIDLKQGVQISCEQGKITIEAENILSQMPEELLHIYDELGIDRELVRAVFEDMAEWAGGYDKLVEGAKAGKLNVATGRLRE